MNWAEFKERLVKSHPGDMEAHERINQAVRLLRDGLQTLGRLGHHFHLAEGTSAVPAEPENEINGGSPSPAGREEAPGSAPSLPGNSTAPLSKPASQSPAGGVKTIRKKVHVTKTPEKKNA
jgi:hypothetical protein